jgi:Fic family protein
MNTKKWIWEHESFPNFTYDKDGILPSSNIVHEKKGAIKARLEFSQEDANNNLTIDNVINEIYSNSYIEGIVLQRDSVRSSIEKRLLCDYWNIEGKKDKSTRYTDLLVELHLDYNTNFEPLNVERLHTWHKAFVQNQESFFFKVDPGKFRDYDNMVIASGINTLKEKIHYQAVPAAQIDKNINVFLEYCNYSKEHPLIKSAVAHLWFESIHPYGDGNGRMGRVIANHILSKELGFDSKFLSLSTAIQKDKENYYRKLDHTNNITYTNSLDLTEWIKWHNETIIKGLDHTNLQIDKAIETTKFYDKYRATTLNDTQRKVIDRMIKEGIRSFEGGISNEKYRKLTGVKPLTASRHLKDLVEKNILQEIQGKGGRSTRYEIATGPAPSLEKKRFR